MDHPLAAVDLPAPRGHQPGPTGHRDAAVPQLARLRAWPASALGRPYDGCRYVGPYAALSGQATRLVLLAAAHGP